MGDDGARCPDEVMVRHALAPSSRPCRAQSDPVRPWTMERVMATSESEPAPSLREVRAVTAAMEAPGRSALIWSPGPDRQDATDGEADAGGVRVNLPDRDLPLVPACAARARSKIR